MSNSSTHRQSALFFPSDLILVGGLGVWTVAVASGYFSETTGRQALGLVALLFAPGYAATAALFPARRSGLGVLDSVNSPLADGNTTSAGSTSSTMAVDTRLGGGNVTLVERLVLAVGLSVCLVPLIGLALAYTPRGVHSASFLGVIGGVTVSLAVLALIRRIRVSPQERFNPGLPGALSHVVGWHRAVGSGSKITILLTVGFVLAGTGLGFAVLDADRGEEFTELYLLTEDLGPDEYSAADYPTALTQGESESVQVGITNEEGETTTYTVVVLLQAIDAAGDPLTVQQVDTFSVTVPAGETWQEPRPIEPEIVGDNLRLTYLLYIDSPPAESELGVDSAYRHVHLWVDIQPAA